MYGTEARDRAVPNHLQTYFRDINGVSLLSASEEHELAEAIAKGDPQARSRMIQANLRLVVRIARDYLGRGMLLEDLIGEGNLGLIRAAQDYDPRFGTRFSTYASYWIKQAIRHALINTSKTIRLPAHMYGLLNRWRRAERALAREFGRAPSFDEVADSLGLSETQRSLVTRARRANQLKLESGLREDGGSWSPEDSVDPTDAPEAALELDEELAEVLFRMKHLEDRERQVLALRFGLSGEDPLTLKEIGRRLGVTREWVRKIEVKAVTRLEHEVGSSIPAAADLHARRPGKSHQARERSAATVVDSSSRSPLESAATGNACPSSTCLPCERRAS